MVKGKYFTTQYKKKAEAFVESNKGKGFYVKKLKKNYVIYKK